ncbi:dTDP-4-amino-4,6-dideoxy-D-glucose acetyltransferase VioB [Opitutales bacterium ASA1]|uniref:NeuD/PglB/VioB family sugar acetyltransferase n=1 Tax=Congregicoccus parvus TaxID=3081749 RepID=UPI002B2C0AB6|nr:dTDP-4-amino-4,6-dideoxy-D-glucose acetyltransferase VioB [Opitutales bacterium ASA1]
MRKLIILGAGGFGREVLTWARQSVQHGTEWEVKGFLDDREAAELKQPLHAPLLGRIADYQPQAEDVFLCAMGTPAMKRACIENVQARGGTFTQLIHRTAIVGDEVELADGVIVCPYAIVSGYSSIGRGVALNMHATVDHDATVGEYTQINCHCDLTGMVSVGCEVYFGSHVSVAPGVTIGDRAYLGIGTVVLRDVAAGTKMFGVPARRVE